jgi:hypothetical protein
MPLPQGIANPAGAFGLPLVGTQLGGATVMTNDGAFVELVNNSGATRTYGDVVIVDVSGLNANTTVIVNNQTVIGVVSQQNPGGTVASGKPMLVQYRGVARVNIGANTVAVGDVLTSFTIAGQAATNNALTAPTIAAQIGVALEAFGAKDTNNTIRVKLCVGV